MVILLTIKASFLAINFSEAWSHHVTLTFWLGCQLHWEFFWLYANQADFSSWVFFRILTQQAKLECVIQHFNMQFCLGVDIVSVVTAETHENVELFLVPEYFAMNNEHTASCCLLSISFKIFSWNPTELSVQGTELNSINLLCSHFIWSDSMIKSWARQTAVFWLLCVRLVTAADYCCVDWHVRMMKCF